MHQLSRSLGFRLGFRELRGFGGCGIVRPQLLQTETEVAIRRAEPARRHGGDRELESVRIRSSSMATFDRPKSGDRIPADLLPVIRTAGVLNDRQLEEIRRRILRGDLPMDPVALAERLVEEDQLTAYQARRLLGNRPRGLVVGRYVILDRIGSGSMGRVYKARHAMMNRDVAIKIIAPEIASNEKVVARFHREMKLVGRLDHPNVVRAFDADRIDQMLFIVMEYVPGESLGQRLKRGPVPAAEMIDYAAQAALGLDHAHRQGMVHRDIKPSNILLTTDRKVKILDLGLGVLMEADSSATFATADGIAVGTVDYMSPEQALGRELDGRSDLFSLGCAMYHLMTGRLAFPGESPIDRLGKRLSSKPVPITEHLPQLPSSVVKVLDRLMAPRPQDRYPTAADAAEALQALLRPKPRSPRSAAAASGPPFVAPANAPARPSADPTSAPPPFAQAEPQPLLGEPPPKSPGDEPAPAFPWWFVPVARLAQRNPSVLVAATAAALAACLGLGFGLGCLLH